MCPVCRYELETDDLAYENERKHRMKTRKLRVRKDELDKSGIVKLKELMSQLGISFAGCVDKRDLVERLVNSGKIDIVEGVPTLEISKSEMATKSVPELKTLLRSFGLPTEGVLYKSELISRLVDSGRVVIIEESLEEDLSRNKPSSSDKPDFPVCADDLPKMSVRELKALYSARGLDSSNICEKDDLIQRLVQTGDFNDTTPFVISGDNTAASTDASPLLERNEHCNNFPQCLTDDSIQLSRSLLTSLPIGEIKSIMSSYNIDFHGCLERADLVDRLSKSSRIYVSDD